MKTIGVIGAGQMGNGIAHASALAGYDVILSDVSLDRAEAGRATIEKNLARQLAKATVTEDEVAAALGRIALTTDNARFAAADLVIEAATEDEDIKAGIFEALAGKLPETAILASNTSSISITRLAARTDRPDRFIGVHFFNPVPVMALIEIICGLATSKATVDALHVFAGRLGKTVIEARDYPGFIVNRVLAPMLNEAIFALGEGMGTVADIDAGMKLGANHPMGPLQLADFIGLDTVLSILNVLHQGFGDPKFRPAPLLVNYVDAGWLGRKSGRGFYDYSGPEPVPTR